jgi:PAS domain S-box-containing protein
MKETVDKSSSQSTKRWMNATSRSIATVFAAIFLIVVGWGLHPYYNWHWTTDAEDQMLESTFSQLLNMQARMETVLAMGAGTGEATWLSQYNSTRPKRSLLVERMQPQIAVSNAASSGSDYAELLAAEQAMTQTEKRIFSLARANRQNEALRLLSSEEYQILKSTYSRSLTNIHRRVVEGMEAREQSQMRIFRFGLIGFFSIVVVVLLAWIRAARTAQKWEAQLAEQRARERKVVGRAVEDGLRSASLRYSMNAAGEAAVDGLAMVNLDFNYDYVNPALCRMHKCENPDTMIGKNVRNFLTDETFSELKEITASVLAGEQSESFEGMARANGELVPVEVAPSLMSSDDGNPWAFLLIVRDVTEQKRAQDELRKTRDFYLSLFEGFPNPVWRADAEGRFDFFNSTWFSFTGRSLAHEIGQGWTEGIHPEDRKRCVKAYTKAFNGREPFNIEFRLRRHDGKYRWMVNCGRPFNDPNGEFAGYIGACYDITERREMEDALEAKNSELEAFVYTVSHDLRAPLVSMAGFARLLDEECGDKINEDGREYLQRIHNNITSMSALLTDLLELSRIGRVEEHKEDVAVSDVIEKVIEEHAILLEEAGAQVDITGNLPTVHGSRTRLAQVFSNFVTNALKFSREGVAPRIEVGCEQVDGAFRFHVKDNGIGIKESDISKVFTIFSRLRQKDVEGSGIGLAIVKRVIEDHGGQVGVESTPGEGSTFWFTLPAAIIQQPVEEEQEWALATSQS